MSTPGTSRLEQNLALPFQHTRDNLVPKVHDEDEVRAGSCSTTLKAGKSDTPLCRICTAPLAAELGEGLRHTASSARCTFGSLSSLGGKNRDVSHRGGCPLKH